MGRTDVPAGSPLSGASPLRGLPVAEQRVAPLLERQAATYGDRTLVRAPEASRSYRQMRDAAASWGATLQLAGVGRGDRVAAMSANRLELLELVLGCGWIGASAVLVNTALRGEQLRHVLHNSGARVLATEVEHEPALAAIDLPDSVEHRWRIDEVETAEPTAAVEEVGPGDALAILYTSGTTGVSKGVLCPQAQFYWWGVLAGELLEIGEDDVLFTTLPMFHTNAVNAFFQALLAGATYSFVPRFSASRFWEQARATDATVTYLLGAMVSILDARPPRDDDRAHRVRAALSPATPVALHERFRERFGVLLYEGYGSTETNLVMGAPRDGQRPGYLGLTLPEFETRVVDEDDVAVPDGVAGELVVRNREPFSVATGYHDMPEATVAAWRNLWFHTGDRVVRDPDGWFRFVDRIKDSIRRRGENISSFEVERVLLEHPAVKEAAVYPVPSELGEDEVMAALLLESGVELDPVALMRHCEPRLAYFAIPRYVEVMDELPLTSNGKVRKPALRERGVAETTWDRERAGYRLAR